ncbi:MAG: glycosyltransferase family 2 protein [Geobacteraceae bacterium]|nr:glycosyltransferase family 2 protein [Geobacteraceae bacterium]
MPNSASNIMISVVICTYNRSELLSHCLRSLAEQTLSKQLYEIIIADNNSHDDTRLIAEEFTRKESNIRICYEERRGANHARNTGVGFARGEYVAFIDDDAIAYSDWLSNILNYIRRHRDVVVFGGPYDAYSLVPTPEWFPPEYGILYLGDCERPLEIGKEWLAGTNLIVKKDVFSRIGGFQEKLGAVENGVFYYGEETRLLVDLSECGYSVCYVPSVRVKHLIRSDRMSLKCLLLAGYTIGRRYELTFNVNRSLLSHMLSLLAGTYVAISQMLRPVRIPFKRRLYYSFYRLYYEAGAVVEHLSTH